MCVVYIYIQSYWNLYICMLPCVPLYQLPVCYTQRESREERSHNADEIIYWERSEHHILVTKSKEFILLIYPKPRCSFNYIPVISQDLWTSFSILYVQIIWTISSYLKFRCFYVLKAVAFILCFACSVYLEMLLFNNIFPKIVAGCWSYSHCV